MAIATANIYVKSIAKRTKGAEWRPFHSQIEHLSKLLCIAAIVKKSKNLLVLTGSKLSNQVEDSEATYFVHNPVIAMTTFTDQQLVNLTPEQVQSLNPEQTKRRQQLLLQSRAPFAPVAYAAPPVDLHPPRES